MRLSAQFKITLAVFSIALIVIAASIAITSQLVSRTRTQQTLANNIAKAASDLAYISNDYVIYHGSQQLDQWQTRYASFSQDVTNLKVDAPEQQAIVDNIRSSQQNMQIVFESIVTTLGSSQIQVSNQSALPSALQISWSRMSIQSQTLVSQATNLEQLLSAQVDQLNLVNSALILAIIGTFSAFVAVVYFQVFRRTLKSIADLEVGTAVIGSGNLNYTLKENKEDEIGHLSKAFNQMCANLKNLTASKIELETEIKERKKAEEEIARIAKFPLENPAVVFRVDQKGAIMFANPAAHGFLEEWQTKVGEHVPEDVKQKVAVALASGDKIEFEANLGEEIFSFLVAPIAAEGYANLYGRGITKRKKAEEALLQAQAKLLDYSHNLENLVEERTKQLKDSERLAAIGATAGMVGHDIRNPLQAITSDVYLAKTELASIPESEEKKNALESLQEIEKNIDYINKIVADLQDYARPLKPVTKETDVEILCEEVLLKSDVPKNIKASCKVDKTAKEVMADPDLLKRVISNLVLNAIQAMPQGGKLSMFTYRKEGNVMIEVQDTGLGIPHEIKEKLFTPMFTTKSKGQGFGLAVVKRVIESMNGTVAFESQEGKGTKFIVRLPPPKELNGKWTYK